VTNEFPPPTPKPYHRKQRWPIWPWLFLIVPAIGASIFVVVTTSRLLVGNAEPPLETTRAFLAAVANEDTETAYQLLCPDTQASLGREAFGQRTALGTSSIVQTRLATAASPTSSRVTVLGDLTTSLDGVTQTRPIFFELVEPDPAVVAMTPASEGSTPLPWLVCFWRIDGERFGYLAEDPASVTADPENNPASADPTSETNNSADS